MKVFMVGGTGLLGSEAACLLIAKGHEVTTLSLEVPKTLKLSSKMKIIYESYLDIDFKKLESYMKGMDAFIFAAGLDDRVKDKKPVYDLYKKYNIDGLEKMLKIATKVGIKHVVVLGSYFSYFAKKWKELKLEENHPYIRSRVEQEKMALSYASDKMSVAVLQLPYIFGVQVGRKPVWTILVENILAMKKITMFPKGGTTMVTVKQVACCIVESLNIKGGRTFPVGYYNMTWKQMLTLFHKYMGCEKKPIITIPTFIFKLGCYKMRFNDFKNKVESGLNMPKFAKAMAREMFIDKKTIVKEFGVQEDDIELAIASSIKLSMDSINGKNLVDMVK